MTDRSHTRMVKRAESRRRGTRRGWRAVAAAFLLLGLLILGLSEEPARAEPVKADVTVNMSGGYARIVFRFSDEIDADVRMANNVLVISFKTPVSVAIDRLWSNAPGYVNAARSDPDGMGVRLALGRKVTMNSMMAGERLFVDLLPDTWTAPPPALPQEVVEELAKRAREAEKKERQQRLLARQRPVPLASVRVAHQPTFSRYVFELPELISVSTERAKDNLKVVFDASLKFDLAAAKSPLPPMIESIDSESDGQTTSVSFAFIGKVDVRSFREDNNFVVDIVIIDGKQNQVDIIPPAAQAPATAETEPRLPPFPPITPLDAPVSMSAQAPPHPPAGPPSAGQATVPDKAAAEAAQSAAPKAPVAPSAEPPPPAAPPASELRGGDAVRPRDPDAPVAVEMRRQAENLKLTFPFEMPTAAAVFRRADTLWLVFDTATKIDLAALNKDTTRTIRSAVVTPSDKGQIVRITLERPRLASLAEDGSFWTVTVGDLALEPTRPLAISRNVAGSPRATAIIPFENPHAIHRITDPDVGDSLLVVTAFGPARGFLKSQDFVEFRALATTHGIAIQPLADDLTAELTGDKVVLGRPIGLALSASGIPGRRTSNYRPLVFDSQLWGFDREANFSDREFKLINAAALAAEAKRSAPRLELARFYLARDMYAEAKAVLDVALSDERPTQEDTTGLVMRAVASIMLSRTDEALKDLANPIVGNQHEAQLWRAVAYTKQGKWAEAREAFRGIEGGIGTLPIELQRLVLRAALRASIEARDFDAAANEFNEFETLGIPPDLEPTLAVLHGRLAEALGRNDDALAAYRAAAESTNRPAAAQGRLRETVLRYQLGDLKRDEVISELENLTTVWRGDETEIEALQFLAHLYTEAARYRDAFHVMRTAMRAHPNSEMTRRIQEEAAATFDSLFLAGKGDAMPAIDALSLFYDFRELTPIGRRGDEMIRRLTDRLVSVDLLDQAAELLQHQVDHRLQGAARAQVATRLAVVYLMNRKPDKALATLNATRTAELSNELRSQRLLLEARALSDIGRHDVALEVVANIEGREAIRLRSDIQWAAKRWREAAEQIELLYGDRWRDWQPLNDAERSDILRAAMGYALAEDKLGLDRFKEKYAAKMAEGPDHRAFDILMSPLAGDSAEFRAVTRSVAAVDTLEAFLRDMRARYPETGSFTPVDAAFGPGQQSRAPGVQSDTTGSLRTARAAAR
jgi:tetratricopeptide (TPR) repeat protein